MAREVMCRQAADNEYLHKDFHGALSCGIEYLDNHFGADAVRSYLRNFALIYHKQLRDRVKSEGLAPLRDYLAHLYEQENSSVHLELKEDELVAEAVESPAVMHMRRNGYPIARLFSETIKTVHETLVEGTAYAYALESYDVETGACRQRFFRKQDAE